jgi:MOSC domain-containing protein YiiM
VARIESVNIGERRSFANDIGRTGIYKTPVAGPVKVTTLGLAGDYVADEKHHGGPDQAVYVYFAEDYAWWSEKLGRTLAPGTFGDNITISGIESKNVAIGDRFIAGDVVLQVTVPRIPCGTLARRMEDREFVKAFRYAERPGVYCRVTATGEISAGVPVTHQLYADDRIGIVAMYRDWYVRKKLSAADLKRTLAAPIGARARRDWEELLAAKTEDAAAELPGKA